VEDSPIINVKKMAELDIAFHGQKIILAEFGLSFLLLTFFGLFALLINHGASLWLSFIGTYLLLVGLNYLPLLSHAITFKETNNAQTETREQRSRHDIARKYGTQQLLILVPITILALAIIQKIGSRN